MNNGDWEYRYKDTKEREAFIKDVATARGSTIKQLMDDGINLIAERMNNTDADDLVNKLNRALSDLQVAIINIHNVSNTRTEKKKEVTGGFFD